MAEKPEDLGRDMLAAVSFAARAHQGQFRHDGATPYASHPFRVCLIVREIFGVADQRALVAAILHDTIEDTKTDFDDVAEQFGEEIAGWVATLSKDKRLKETEREEAYVAGLREAPWQVQVCKLGDVYDNLLDARTSDAKKRSTALRNARRYLDALKSDRPEVDRRWKLVSDLLADLECQETGRSGGA